MSYNTRRNYTGDLRKHVFGVDSEEEQKRKPAHRVANIQLSSLTTQDIRKLLADVGGSQHLQANLRNAIARLLKDAQKEGLIPEGRRVTDAITSARSVKSRDQEGNVVETYRVLTEKEQTAILKTASGHWAYLGILIQLKMGLRRGEVVAIRRDDIMNGQLSVKEQLTREKGSGVIRSKTKTPSSVRCLPIPQVVTKALKRNGGRNYILENFEAKIDPDFYTKTVSELIDRSGVNGTLEAPIFPRATSHDLRHTFGSIAASKLKFPIKTLSIIMGHANITTTLKYYVHADADDMQSVMALVQ